MNTIIYHMLITDINMKRYTLKDMVIVCGQEMIKNQLIKKNRLIKKESGDLSDILPIEGDEEKVK